MKRITLSLLIAAGFAVLPSAAAASDATLKSALKAYETKLTTDIGYLSSFSTPSKNGAKGALQKLSKIDKDLAGATKAANKNQGSTANGKKGRTEILAALKDATAADSSAQACAKAAHAAKHSAAKSALKQEQRQINKAIPLFESGGKLLKLF